MNKELRSKLIRALSDTCVAGKISTEEADTMLKLFDKGNGTSLDEKVEGLEKTLEKTKVQNPDDPSDENLPAEPPTQQDVKEFNEGDKTREN